MTKASGYILNVDGARRDELLEAFEFGETPSESVPTFSHNSNIPLIAFVGFRRGSITHLANARLGQGAGTRRRRLSLRDMVALQEPVLHRDIMRLVNSRVRSSVTQRLSDGGL